MYSTTTVVAETCSLSLSKSIQYIIITPQHSTVVFFGTEFPLDSPSFGDAVVMPMISSSSWCRWEENCAGWWSGISSSHFWCVWCSRSHRCVSSPLSWRYIKYHLLKKTCVPNLVGMGNSRLIVLFHIFFSFPDRKMSKKSVLTNFHLRSFQSYGRVDMS